MTHLTWFKAFGIGIGLCGAFFAACSSGSSTGGADNGDGGGGPGNGIQANCTGLSVLFSPMYSASDGVHTFQVPAIVNGATNTSGITWVASDPSTVSLAADPTTGGTMITILKAGPPVTIQATDGKGGCGQSTLNITAATPQQWQNGSDRYHNGYILPGRGDGGRPDANGFDAAVFTELACTNCHGENSNPNARFKDVSHTPEQTGGFSDNDLVDIFMNGTLPEAGAPTFDPAVICGTGANCTFDTAYARWSSFHNWTMTDDEKTGIIVYLRSLQPAAQAGSSNFGGRCDGGRCPRPDGGFRPDSGGPPPGNDSGQPDTGSIADDSGNNPG